MSTKTREVVVVGGGISGLTLSWQLHAAGVDVLLLDAGGDIGGCMRTETRDGFLLEKGPFNVMVRDPSFEQLLAAFSDELNIVSASPSARKRFVYHEGQLHPVPSSPLALATTKILSPFGKARLLAGLLWSRPRGSDEETIAQVATRRFGEQVATRLVGAAVAGIFAGDIFKLSLSACFPGPARLDANARSLLATGLTRALFGRGAKFKPRWRGLISIDGGLGALTSAMGKRLGEHLQQRTHVESVVQTPNGFELKYRQTDGGQEELSCRHLVMATPTPETVRLLRAPLPDAAIALDTMTTASMVVLNFGFRRADVSHPLDGFGFLVPQCEGRFPLLGTLWADSVFPHHAPAGHCLIRVFMGGARDPDVMRHGDDTLIRTAIEALRDPLQLRGDPVLVDVCRWPGAIPQYHVGHLARVRQLRSAVARAPGLHLVGNYLEGVSINDCVRLATRVAGEINGGAATFDTVDSPATQARIQPAVQRVAG